MNDGFVLVGLVPVYYGRGFTECTPRRGRKAAQKGDRDARNKTELCAFGWFRHIEDGGCGLSCVSR
ncbi:hypothetical protein SERLA73DRAFT_133121 [Serpula lacrymans var. lacrymans S7.3]|uniref:Uncharacterized protein n=1 Tax=Serpula lacrymans var. lacrymans (strain S7.3) TaxID=936435 RepID=F8PQH2_SERL3|nr:hypothetical protein SERLA73DRAFT_133121 [Serpula lacrymans var. lacrymans S7.3]